MTAELDSWGRNLATLPMWAYYGEDDEVVPADRDALRASLGVEPGARVVAVLPGSRRHEVARQLPLQLAACRRLASSRPGLRAWVVRAPSITPEELRAAAGPGFASEDLRVDFVDLDARAAISASDVVLAKPGTVTLEAALLGRPMVVIARVQALTAFWVRRLVTLSHYAMPNLIAGETIVPELVQEEATASAVAEAVEALFDGPARERQCKELAAVAARLGEGGAAQRVCDLAEKWLAHPTH